MKRAIAATALTAAGVVWVLTYRISPHVMGQVQPPPDAGGARLNTPAPSAPTGPSGTFTGAPIATVFGTTQVRITVAGGRITDVQNVQLPFDRQLSAQISQYAGPILRQEALAAQSAHVDIVSGASYTSDSFMRSLQDALDQAGPPLAGLTGR